MFPTKTNPFIPIPKGTIVVAYVLIYARHEIRRQISFLWQEGVLVHARYLQPTTGAIFSICALYSKMRRANTHQTYIVT